METIKKSYQIPDQDAQIFWKKNFGDKTHIPNTQFFNKLISNFTNPNVQEQLEHFAPLILSMLQSRMLFFFIIEVF